MTGRGMGSERTESLGAPQAAACGASRADARQSSHPPTERVQGPDVKGCRKQSFIVDKRKCLSTPMFWNDSRESGGFGMRARREHQSMFAVRLRKRRETDLTRSRTSTH